MATSAARTWADAAPAPLVLISGPERVLAERALAAVVQELRHAHPDGDVVRLDAASYERGTLQAGVSPSLFGAPAGVVIDGAEAMNEDCAAAILDYVAAPEPGVSVVVCHGGGQRGKKALDAMRGAGAAEYRCEAIKRDSDFVDFASAELKRAGAKAPAAAVRALVDAVGNDLPEIISACQQLARDVSGTVDEDAVRRYYGTRVNATGFAVADAAVAGDVGRALSLARHALDSGVDPVPLVAALAGKLRAMAKVGAARGRGLDPAKDLGMAPWQADRARRDLRKWRADTVAEAIAAVAQADAEVKGAARDPRYAVERALLRVASLADR